MANQVPLIQDGYYTEKVTLSGDTFILRVRYNSRMDRWLMDILDSISTPLVLGIVMVEEWALTDKFINRLTGIPSGFLVLLDQSQTHREMTYDLAGADIQLFYGA